MTGSEDGLEARGGERWPGRELAQCTEARLVVVIVVVIVVIIEEVALDGCEEIVAGRSTQTTVSKAAKNLAKSAASH